LSVEQVTRVLVGDSQVERFERAQRSDDSEGREIFGDVAHFGFEYGGFCELGLFFGEEVIVFLECGTAAGGIGDNGVEFVTGESDKIFASEIARGVADSGVGRERSATHLSFGDDDFDAVGVENADGGVVEAREGNLRDAASEEGDASALWPYRGKGAAEFLKEKWRFDFREELLAIGETEKFEHAAKADESLQAGLLIKPDETGESGNAIGVREQFPECEVAGDASEERALVVALDESACVLDKFAVLDGGGAGGFAGAAVEAFVDVLDERFGDLRAGRRTYSRGRRGHGDGLRLSVFGADGSEIGLRNVDHLVNAAARRVSLQVPKAIGGAGVETDAAVDAAGEVCVLGILAGDRGGGSHLRSVGLGETVARRESVGAATFRRVSFWEKRA
jgi:hypothetical protein